MSERRHRKPTRADLEATVTALEAELAGARVAFHRVCLERAEERSARLRQQCAGERRARVLGRAFLAWGPRVFELSTDEAERKLLAVILDAEAIEREIGPGRVHDRVDALLDTATELVVARTLHRRAQRSARLRGLPAETRWAPN